MRRFAEKLEQAGELVRIREFVNPELEITEITDRVSKTDGPALWFENTGTKFPVLINSMGSYKRMCMAMGVDHMDDVTKEIERLFHDLTGPKQGILEKLKMLPTLARFASWMPKVKSGRGLCQQVVMDPPNLDALPILKTWPHDGGPFITLPIVHTKDPETGIRNVGMYRVQKFDSLTTALHWQLHKVSRRHYEAYKRLGKRMPVAVVLGGDPLYSYAATAPLPEGIDEYILAGFIRKKKVELVKCLTQPDIEVPADADIVIEGYVDTAEDMLWEGPFGDHTGYYSLPDWYPAFHVTAITHKKDAVYPATIVGIPPQEDAWIGKATERIFLAPIKMTMVPEIIDMELPIEGVFHNMALVKIKKEFPGQALKVMNTLWGAGQMMFTKMIVIVDEHAPWGDYTALAKYVSDNCDPEHDVVLGKGPIDVLDHSCSSMAFGGKMGIDGTRKLPEELADRTPAPKPDATAFDDAVILSLQAQFPEITAVNAALLKLGISIVFVALRKTETGHVKRLARQLFEHPAFETVKTVILMDHNVDIFRVQDAVWRFCNNTDVKRDCLQLSADETGGISHMALDGTRKTKALDNFDRPWPEILVMDDATIAKVDALWPKLGLGEFVPSPSLRYKPQVYGNAAVAPEVEAVLVSA
jgi:4-hydroxy-3-polyprenylbenzoate decarboxylase